MSTTPIRSPNVALTHSRGFARQARLKDLVFAHARASLVTATHKPVPRVVRNERACASCGELAGLDGGTPPRVRTSTVQPPRSDNGAVGSDSMRLRVVPSP